MLVSSICASGEDLKPRASPAYSGHSPVSGARGTRCARRDPAALTASATAAAIAASRVHERLITAASDRVQRESARRTGLRRRLEEIPVLGRVHFDRQPAFLHQLD